MQPRQSKQSAQTEHHKQNSNYDETKLRLQLAQKMMKANPDGLTRNKGITDNP